MPERPTDPATTAPSALGSLTGASERWTATFTRELDATPDEVWDALTSPERLARWLARTEIEPRQGGRIHHDFGDDGATAGTIRVWDPPRVLEYDWAYTGEPGGVLRFELTPTERGTRLHLVHRGLALVEAAGYGAGWHAHLDRLDALLHDAATIDWAARFQQLLPHYRAQMGA